MPKKSYWEKFRDSKIGRYGLLLGYVEPIRRLIQGERANRDEDVSNIDERRREVLDYIEEEEEFHDKVGRKVKEIEQKMVNGEFVSEDEKLFYEESMPEDRRKSIERAREHNLKMQELKQTEEEVIKESKVEDMEIRALLQNKEGKILKNMAENAEYLSLGGVYNQATVEELKKRQARDNVTPYSIDDLGCSTENVKRSDISKQYNNIREELENTRDIEEQEIEDER